MISKIIKQIWNQRRTNGWIFIELVITGFFLWTVIEPVYVLMVNRLEPKGYQEDGRYVVNLGAYGKTHGLRDTTITNAQRKEAFFRISKLVREQPEVESAYLSLHSSMPNSLSWNGGQFYPDTLSYKEEKYTHAQWYEVLSDADTDIFHTLGIKDARTGEELKMPEDVNTHKTCFVSEQFAKRMFGSIEVVGKEIFDTNIFCKIAGVFQEIKTRDYSGSYPLIIYFAKDFYMHDYVHRNYFIVFKLKDGVDFDAFNERFKKEVAPHMNQGNFYFEKFKTFADMREELGTMNGVYNQLRLKLSLAAFALLCIFLGMVGTFWIRCNARRQEIGLMRSMGATEGRIRKQFLTEAGLLVSVAFVFSLLLVVNFVVMADEGMTKQQVTGYTDFAYVSEWLSPAVQFGMVSLLTYLSLMLIALVGTFIPVKRASEVLPANALKDE